jgi:TonB family protein
MRKSLILLSLGLVLASFSVGLRGEEKAPQFEPPQIVATQAPVYPVNTVQPGTVILAVKIDPSGEIESVKTLQGASGFVEAAKQALKGWRFKPATLDGVPTTAVIPIAFAFSQPTVWWPTKK